MGVSRIGIFDSNKLFSVLAFLAIAFSPFQLALTVAIAGNPLKISEILLILCFLTFPLTSYMQVTSPGGILIFIFSIIFSISSLFNLVSQGSEVNGFIPGVSMSPSADLIFYFAFSFFALLSWKVLSTLPPDIFLKAIILATWLCTFAVLFQFWGVWSGNTQLVESFGFESEGRLEGQVVSTRNGPFKEGQHLGFYAGFLFIACLSKRKWLTSIAALFCVYYSFSTTAIVGIAFVALVLFIVNIKIKNFLVLCFGGIGVIISYYLFPQVQSFFNIQLAKLGLISSFGGSNASTVSLDLRELKTHIAWSIMSENPIIGVGPGRYSIWFFQDPLSNEAPKYYFNHDHRAIAENAYAHIGAEGGVFLLSIFISFIAYLSILSIKYNNRTTLCMLAFLTVGVSTQSTWMYLPIWVSFALVSAMLRKSIQNPESMLLSYSKSEK